MFQNPDDIYDLKIFTEIKKYTDSILKNEEDIYAMQVYFVINSFI